MRVSADTRISRPCSSQVYQLTLTSARSATSSRRSPGVRRRTSGKPSSPGFNRARRLTRKDPSARRSSDTRSLIGTVHIPNGVENGYTAALGAPGVTYHDKARKPLPSLVQPPTPFTHCGIPSRARCRWRTPSTCYRRVVLTRMMQSCRQRGRDTRVQALLFGQGHCGWWSPLRRPDPSRG